MKYRNASELLPAQLLQELQRYAHGQILYVPSANRKPWGAGTGAKSLYARRNAEIRNQHSSGTGMHELGEKFWISEDAVRKIIYTKGGAAMNAKAFDYSQYFWQNQWVRVRRSRPDDWQYHDAGYNSEERFFTDGEQELPTGEDVWKEKRETYIKANENSEKWICLAFETLDGEYKGGGNLRFDDERNGVFDYFVGGEERYVAAALQLMLDYAFNERRMNKCQTCFIEGDAYSMKMAEKLGFTKEGVLRGKVFHKGRFWDEHHYGMFAAEFNAQQK